MNRVYLIIALLRGCTCIARRGWYYCSHIRHSDHYRDCPMHADLRGKPWYFL